MVGLRKLKEDGRVKNRAIILVVAICRVETTW